MTELDEINRKLDAIIEHLGIGAEVRRSKKSIEDQMAVKILDLQKRRKKTKTRHAGKANSAG